MAANVAECRNVSLAAALAALKDQRKVAAGDLTIVRPTAAEPPRRPEPVEMRRARVFGAPPPRDKEHHLASRKCRRESTVQTHHARLQSYPGRCWPCCVYLYKEQTNTSL
jgi:hypothetical protein